MPMDETAGSVTERQSKFIVDLVAKKDLRSTKLSDEQRAYLEGGNYAALSKAQASKVIGLLLELNDKPVEPAIPQKLPESATFANADIMDQEEYTFGGAARADAYAEEQAERAATPPVQVSNNPRKELADELTQLESEVDAGYYFVVNTALVKNGRNDPNNGERFYHVSKPEPPSRWAGYTFIESRGGDFLYKVRDMQQRIDILKEIKKDPVTAMNEYGIRLGVCGCCGRTLTARDSRLRGIGPICAQRLMMEDAEATDDQIDMLRQLGLKKD